MTRRRRDMRPLPAPGWRVRIAAHTVDRYAIDEQDLVVRAHSEHAAQRKAVCEAHRCSGVAPWRPLIRASLAHATVLGRVA